MSKAFFLLFFLLSNAVVARRTSFSRKLFFSAHSKSHGLSGEPSAETELLSQLTVERHNLVGKNETKNSELDLSFSPSDPKEFRKVMAKVYELPSVSLLCMDNTHFNSYLLRILLQTIRNSPFLNYLSLSNCGLHDCSMKLLNNLLKANYNLTFLDLSRNELSLNNLKSIFPLGANYSLEYLDLSYNNLKDEGVDYLVALLQNNQFPSLKHIILREVSKFVFRRYEPLQSIFLPY
jgi:hypothetical protein